MFIERVVAQLKRFPSDLTPMKVLWQIHRGDSVISCHRKIREPDRLLRALCLAASLIACVPGCSLGKDAVLGRFEFTEPQMGVPFRIVLYAADREQASTAAQAAFARVAQLNEVMSDYETDSELNELSRTSGKGQMVRVSPDLWTVLELAQALAHRTDGAFDITVGPTVSLWRRARRNQQMPPPDRLAEALKAVGYQHVRLDPAHHTVELLASRMKLDLGGIAKGFALDAALKVLVDRGIHRALVSGGGDIATADPPPGQPGWRIEIAPLDVPNAPPKRYVRLSRMALATSGDVFQRLEIDGRRYSHIVDPRTGVGLTDHCLVTIIATNCTTADSLATAASVLGPEKALRLIEDTPGAEMHVVRKPGDQIEARESSGFQRFNEQSEPATGHVIGEPPPNRD